MFPLFVKIATPAQATAVVKTVESTLLKNGGIVTTTNNTGQQWDAPNGWAPLQWVAVTGLKNYNQNKLAKTITQRWLALVEKVYANRGKLMEKYNVEDLSKEAGGGEYPSQDGFGWTNGVYLALKKLN
jgi:alpha,alpha-trehalase